MLCKANIRKRMKQLSSSFGEEKKSQWSHLICSAIESRPEFIRSTVILLYHALPDEPNLQELFDRWTEKKTLLLPVVKGDDLVLRTYTSSHSLNTGAFGIKEPAGEDWTDYSSITLAIVPGVCFDNSCRRLGRGRGYYDRLLSRPDMRHAYKLGCAFPFRKVEALPEEPHDIRMDDVL